MEGRSHGGGSPPWTVSRGGAGAEAGPLSREGQTASGAAGGWQGREGVQGSSRLQCGLGWGPGSVASQSRPSAWPSGNRGWNRRGLPQACDRDEQGLSGDLWSTVPGRERERERAQTASAFTVVSHCGAPVSEQWMGQLGGAGTALAARGHQAVVGRVLEKSTEACTQAEW